MAIFIFHFDIFNNYGINNCEINNKICFFGGYDSVLWFGTLTILGVYLVWESILSGSLSCLGVYLVFESILYGTLSCLAVYLVQNKKISE